MRRNNPDQCQICRKTLSVKFNLNYGDIWTKLNFLKHLHETFEPDKDIIKNI